MLSLVDDLDRTHAALMMDGKILIPAERIATTNGDADAPPLVPSLTACASCVLRLSAVYASVSTHELESTTMPMMRTPKM